MQVPWCPREALELTDLLIVAVLCAAKQGRRVQPLHADHVVIASLLTCRDGTPPMTSSRAVLLTAPRSRCRCNRFVSSSSSLYSVCRISCNYCCYQLQHKSAGDGEAHFSSASLDASACAGSSASSDLRFLRFLTFFAAIPLLFHRKSTTRG